MSDNSSTPRKGKAPPPPNNAERAQKRRGRPPKDRPPEQMHLPPEPPEKERQLVRSDGTVDGDVLLDLFLANVSPDLVREAFGVDPENFNSLLARVSTQTLEYVETVLDQLTLKNIARVERLMTTWLPIAQGGADKGAKTVIDLIRLERDLLNDAREEVKTRQNAGMDEAATLDDYAAMIESQIENTFTKGSPMYNFAMSVLTDQGSELAEFTNTVVNDDTLALLAAVAEEQENAD